jgi:hypothetical protein
MVKIYVDLAGRTAWMRDQAIAGACPFTFCLLGNCRLFDADAEAAGERFGYKLCPTRRSVHGDTSAPGRDTSHQPIPG